MYLSLLMPPYFLPPPPPHRASPSFSTPSSTYYRYISALSLPQDSRLGDLKPATSSHLITPLAMPVLSETPSSSTMSGPSSYGTYIFALLTISLMLLTLLTRHLKNHKTAILPPPSGSPSKSSSQLAARIPSASALPEKQPYYPPQLTVLPHSLSNKSSMEKESHSAPLPLSQSPISNSNSNGNIIQTGVSTSAPRIPRPPPPPPFKLGSYPEPPSPSLSMLQTQFSLSENPPYQNEPLTQNQILAQMTLVPSPTEYTSFEALYSQNPPYSSDALSFHSTAPGQADLPPRRRSYIKSLSNGSEVSGEIVVSSSGVEGQSWRRHTRVFGGGVCKACEESERRLSA